MGRHAGKRRGDRPGSNSKPGDPTGVVALSLAALAVVVIRRVVIRLVMIRMQTRYF
jgi:hypothetical protein